MSWTTVFSGVFKVAALRSAVCKPDGAGLDDVKNFIGSTTSEGVEFVVQSGSQARDEDMNTAETRHAGCCCSSEPFDIF